MVLAAYSTSAGRQLYNDSTLKACVGCCSEGPGGEVAPADCRVFRNPGGHDVYSATTEYGLGDVVLFKGRSWEWINDNPDTGREPSSAYSTVSDTWWRLYSTATAYDWNSELDYIPNDVIYKDEYYYRCLTAHKGIAPLVGGQSNEIWEEEFAWQIFRGLVPPINVGNRNGAEWDDSSPFGGVGNSPTCYTITLSGMNVEGTTDMVDGVWHVSRRRRVSFSCSYSESITVSGGSVSHEAISGGILLFTPSLAIEPGFMWNGLKDVRTAVALLRISQNQQLGNGFEGYMPPGKTHGLVDNVWTDPPDRTGGGQHVGLASWGGQASFYPGCWELWNNSTAYVVGDTVVDDLGYYECNQDHTGQKPPNASYWDSLT